MNVGELIDELRKYNSNVPVLIQSIWVDGELQEIVRAEHQPETDDYYESVNLYD